MNVFCINNISVRHTVIELQPFIRLVIRTRDTRLQGHPRSKLMVPLERAPMNFYLKVAKRIRRTISKIYTILCWNHFWMPFLHPSGVIVAQK